MHNSGDIKDLLALTSEPAVRKQIQSLKGGRGFVAMGAEYGESIQVQDGRWLTCKVSAEVRLPCHETAESVSTAAQLTGDLSQSLARWALQQAQANVQAEINNEPST